jgi:hypothetical protein
MVCLKNYNYFLSLRRVQNFGVLPSPAVQRLTSVLKLTLVNITIHTFTSHTHLFDGMYSGFIELYFLVPLDIIISIA